MSLPVSNISPKPTSLMQLYGIAHSAGRQTLESFHQSESGFIIGRKPGGIFLRGLRRLAATMRFSGARNEAARQRGAADKFQALIRQRFSPSAIQVAFKNYKPKTNFLTGNQAMDMLHRLDVAQFGGIVSQREKDMWGNALEDQADPALNSSRLQERSEKAKKGVRQILEKAGINWESMKDTDQGTKFKSNWRAFAPLLLTRTEHSEAASVDSPKMVALAKFCNELAKNPAENKALLNNMRQADLLARQFLEEANSKTEDAPEKMIKIQAQFAALAQRINSRLPREFFGSAPNLAESLMTSLLGSLVSVRSATDIGGPMLRNAFANNQKALDTVGQTLDSISTTQNDPGHNRLFESMQKSFKALAFTFSNHELTRNVASFSSEPTSQPESRYSELRHVAADSLAKAQDETNLKKMDNFGTAAFGYTFPNNITPLARRPLRQEASSKPENAETPPPKPPRRTASSSAASSASGERVSNTDNAAVPRRPVRPAPPPPSGGASTRPEPEGVDTLSSSPRFPRRQIPASQTQPSQAQPSQAQPSQAQPSQAQPSQTRNESEV